MLWSWFPDLSPLFVDTPDDFVFHHERFGVSGLPGGIDSHNSPMDRTDPFEPAFGENDIAFTIKPGEYPPNITLSVVNIHIRADNRDHLERSKLRQADESSKDLHPCRRPRFRGPASGRIGERRFNFYN